MATADQAYSCTPLTGSSPRIYTSGTDHFEAVTFVALGEPFMGNLLAEGYSFEQAQVSSARRERCLLNRARRALAAHDLQPSRSGVVNWSDLCAIPAYRDSLALVRETFSTSSQFAQAVTQLTTDYLSTKPVVGDMPMAKRVELAAGYYLAELPLWLDTPAIFGHSSSSFCYQSAGSFVERLWNGDFPLCPAKTQGYLSITLA